MEQLVLCIAVWLLVFIIIPFGRIKEIGIVAFIGFAWMVLVDNISTILGYYSYHHMLLSIGYAPVFQNLAEGGIGILMVNWLTERSYTKLLAVLAAAVCFNVLHTIYIMTGALTFGRFDMALNFIHHTTALSIFTWLALIITGEERIYHGLRTRKWLHNFA